MWKDGEFALDNLLRFTNPLPFVPLTEWYTLKRYGS